MEALVSEAEAGMRLDALLKGRLPEFSRAKIQQAIKSGHCHLDNQSITDPALKPKQGQRITFNIETRQSELQPSKADLQIIWQDSDIAICAKPAGLTVHPCPSCSEETMANQLLAAFPQLASQGGERPGIVHRLDKDTSGLMAIGLSENSRLKLAEMFAERKIHKEYLALVAGEAPETGECREAIARHPSLKTRMAILDERRGGKPAHTEWRRLWSNGKISLLRVTIHSGRTHQIRVHMAHLGFPLLGDKVYAPKAIASLAPRQMLHAARLRFKHPFTANPIDVSLSPPEDFFAAALANSRSLRRIVVTGNQGCGKSSFCKALANLGLPLISADEIVARLYGRSGDASFWIRQHFGDDAINSDGSVNKQRLFALLQASPIQKKELEQVVHALVEAQIEQFWLENTSTKAAVAEIPLFFESNLPAMQAQRPLVVGISCPAKIRWQRIAASRGWNQEKIAAIESWQWPEEKKMAACDEIIDNSGSQAGLKESARAFLEELAARAAKDDEILLDTLKRLCNPNAYLRQP